MEGSGIEWAITDGPLLLGKVYGAKESCTFRTLIEECHRKFHNFNVLLKRNPDKIYHPESRVQKTLKEALEKDRYIIEMLEIRNSFIIPFQVGKDSAHKLLQNIEKQAGN